MPQVCLSRYTAGRRDGNARRARRVVREHGEIGMTLIDYLQLIADWRRVENRPTEILKYRLAQSSGKRIPMRPGMRCRS